MKPYHIATLFLLAISGTAFATTSAMFDKEHTKGEQKEFSPYVNRGYPTNVYFGDTHLHTSLSMDAGTFGNRLGLDDAYRFTRGEEVTASKGFKAKLGRPLDFVVVADHSDGMGFFNMFAAGDPAIMDKQEGRRWNKAINEGGQASVDAALEIITLFSQGKFPWKTNDPEMTKPVWHKVIEAAEKYNDPGRFTAFIGYEWTSLVKGNNLHRVVIYRDGGNQARQTLPFTLADSADPEDLWTFMQAYEEKTGGDLLAIPHNGNLSNGLMFDVETLSGGPIDKGYAERRQHWEPLYETTQIKGDGEAHPLLSPDDEFADYETWDLGNLDLSQAKTDDMLAGEYARAGLKRGLEFAEKLGVNPYKFGQIGSTDSHTSLPAVAGYARGVPMGGDLPKVPPGQSPTFLVAALKDALSGNLDRIQIIKGWVGKGGKAQERVYDVAVSDGRKIDQNGRCKVLVGNTVNVAEATWSNSIGAPELITVWTDPDFNPDERAFYYARVIEIPTPRWTAYEAKRFNIEMPEEAEMVTQERAYTSPIWYTPES